MIVSQGAGFGYTIWRMLDPALVRDNLDAVRRSLAARGARMDAELDALAALDAERRTLIPKVEELKRQQNASGEEVARAKKAGQDASHLFAASKARGAEIKALEAALEALEARRRATLLTIPNMPHETVPVGASAAENVVARAWGEPRTFDFAPRSHAELGPELGILDFERAARMSGARFAVLTGAGARLSRALIDFMLDLHTREHGYTEVDPPFLVNAAALQGTGNLPKFEADLFRIGGDWDLYLIPTAEVPLTNLHREEILDGRLLPLRYTAYTPCFRSEAGSYGQDVKGLIRQHQFHKVELVAFVPPDRALDELEHLTRSAEAILEALELPYRRVALCTGDLGFSSRKTYDLEVWLPSQGCYREISSCSWFGDFQARRAGIRFRAKEGKPAFVHTLNGSGLAVGRTWVALLENGQQPDGSIVLPEALHPYMGCDVLR